jgi:large subunit ribosomal protein L29
MAIINKNELKAMNKSDLQTKLNDLRRELIKENAGIAVGTTPKSPGKIKQIKKTIAKIIQLLNTKEEEKAK